MVLEELYYFLYTSLSPSWHQVVWLQSNDIVNVMTEITFICKDWCRRMDSCFATHKNKMLTIPTAIDLV